MSRKTSLSHWLTLCSVSGFTIASAVACSSAQAPRELQQTAGSEINSNWAVVLHPAFGTLSFAKPKQATSSILVDTNDKVEAAQRFLERNANTFHIAGAELGEGTVIEDKWGSHISFTQSVNGVPVRGTRLTVHLKLDGSVAYVGGLWAGSAAHVETKSGQTPARAVAAAKADLIKAFPNFEDAWLMNEPRAELEIEVNSSSDAALVHAVTFSMPFRAVSMRYLVDAQSGVVRDKVNDFTSFEASGKGVRAHAKDSRNNPSDIKQFEVGRSEVGFQPYQMYRKGTEESPEVTVIQPNLALTGSVMVTSLDPNRWDETGPGAGAAVDAYATMIKVDQYFTNLGTVLGGAKRRSWDNKGAPIAIGVHVPKSADGKGLSGCNMGFGKVKDKDIGIMLVGDGDGQNVPNGCLPLGGEVDAVAHEYMHGIINADLGWIGGQPDDVGALHESFADIFGMLAERSFEPDEVKNSQMGEGGLIGTARSPMRDIANPSKSKWPGVHGDHVTKRAPDNQQHQSSTIPSHAFWLMVTGGTNATSGITVPEAIGWEAGEKLYYSMVTSRSLSSRPVFTEVARVAIATADTMDIPKASVACAWAAVGVLTIEQLKNDFDISCDATTTLAPPDPDSCIGKADGFFCSKVTLSAGFDCKNEQYVGGRQCGSNQVCQGVAGDDELLCK